MFIVYDLDGTLVDTRLANLRAYEEIGVTPPSNFHTVDWKSWTTPVIHDAKNRHLENIMEDNVRELPLLAVARRQKATVLSNISLEAFMILRKYVHLESLTISIGLDSRGKVDMLKMIEEDHGRSGVYVDDSFLTCQLVQQMTSWQVLHAGRFEE